mgnify:CR=1 FL=1
MRLISVKDDYINFLLQHDKNVMWNKEEKRRHTRKYLGVVFDIGGFHYFIPLSSPKSYDYKEDGSPRKSDMFCSRMTRKDRDNQIVLMGKLLYSSMIPVPSLAIQEYDIDAEEDIDYQNLIRNEYDWILLRKGEIISKSLALYNIVVNKKFAENDLRFNKVVDFHNVEKASYLYSSIVK